MDRIGKETYEKYMEKHVLELIAKYNVRVRLHLGFPDGHILSAKVYGDLLQEIFTDTEILYLSSQFMMNRVRQQEEKAKFEQRIKNGGGFLGGISGPGEGGLLDLLSGLKGLIGDDNPEDDDE